MASKTRSNKSDNQSKSDDLKKSIAKLKKTRRTISDETDQTKKKAKKLKNKKGKKSKLKKLKEVLTKLLKKEKKVTSKLKELKKEKKANKLDEPKTVKKPEKKKKKVILDKNEGLNEALDTPSSTEHENTIIAKEDQPLNHSSIDHNVKEAVTHIRTLTDLQDIDIYVLGDTRITVQKAADSRKNNLLKNQ